MDRARVKQEVANYINLINRKEQLKCDLRLLERDKKSLDELLRLTNDEAINILGDRIQIIQRRIINKKLEVMELEDKTMEFQNTISRFDKEDREILELLSSKKYSWVEICERFHISKATLSRRHNKILDKLTEILN